MLNNVNNERLSILLIMLIAVCWSVFMPSFWLHWHASYDTSSMYYKLKSDIKSSYSEIKGLLDTFERKVQVGCVLNDKLLSDIEELKRVPNTDVGCEKIINIHIDTRKVLGILIKLINALDGVNFGSDSVNIRNIDQKLLDTVCNQSIDENVINTEVKSLVTLRKEFLKIGDNIKSNEIDSVSRKFWGRIIDKNNRTVNQVKKLELLMLLNQWRELYKLSVGIYEFDEWRTDLKRTLDFIDIVSAMQIQSRECIMDMLGK